MFDKAQEQLKRDQIIRSETKEFAFTKMITCGLCGSGITADEKFKKQKNGNTHRYVYYGCSRSRDKNCKCGYINEENLIEQLINIMDKLDMNELCMKQKFQEEISRLNKFQKSFLGEKKMAKLNIKEVNLKDYAKYLLKEGAPVEKRELLSCLKSRLVIRNKMIELE